ncbi:MAG TPA: response regulator [Bacteroidia bacterium]|nr:response regulator [Bacteroidia bacterium]
MTSLNRSKLNVLLVEDDNDDQYFFKEALEQLDFHHEVSFAKDCYELFSLLDDQRVFDIIFMDINLPGIDGRGCLQQIKKYNRYKDIPIIIFTVSFAESDIDFMYKNGAHFYVVKPYAHISYLATLKTVFELDWKKKQPRPAFEDFTVNLSVNS